MIGRVRVTGDFFADFVAREHAGGHIDSVRVSVYFANFRPLFSAHFVQRLKVEGYAVVNVPELRELNDVHHTLQVVFKNRLLQSVNVVVENADFAVRRCVKAIWSDAQQLDERDARNRRHVLLRLCLQGIQTVKRGVNELNRFWLGRVVVFSECATVIAASVEDIKPCQKTICPTALQNRAHICSDYRN